MTDVRDTSIIAHEQIEKEGMAASIRESIFLAIQKNPGMTDRELSESMGIRINTYTGSRNCLMKDGRVVPGAKRIDNVSNRMAYTWYTSQTQGRVV